MIKAPSNVLATCIYLTGGLKGEDRSRQSWLKKNNMGTIVILSYWANILDAIFRSIHSLGKLKKCFNEPQKEMFKVIWVTC